MLIHKRILKALALMSSKDDDMRYGLAGVKVTAKGEAVATDGTVLLFHKTKNAEAKSYPEVGARGNVSGGLDPIKDPAASVEGTIPLEMVKRATRTARAGQRGSTPGDDMVAVLPSEFDGKLRMVMLGGNAADVMDNDVIPLDGVFPAWERVLPTGEMTLRVTIGADKLERLAKAAKLGRSVSPCVCFEFQKKTYNNGTSDDLQYLDGVKVVIPTNVPDGPMMGVVMPMRGGDDAQ